MNQQEHSDMARHNAHTARQMEVVTDAICCAQGNLMRALENAKGTGSPFEAVRELLATYTAAAKRIADDAVRIADECAAKASEHASAVTGEEGVFAASAAREAQGAAQGAKTSAAHVYRHSLEPALKP